MASPKVKEGFEIEEYTVVERDPKTENSFRILKVPKAIMERGGAQAPLCRDEERMVRRKL